MFRRSGRITSLYDWWWCVIDGVCAVLCVIRFKRPPVATLSSNEADGAARTLWPLGRRMSQFFDQRQDVQIES